MTGADELVREQRGPVLVARLNRPDARNALSPGLIREIGAALTDAESDDAVRAVVLTGTGDRAFCAGMDLRAFASGEQAEAGGEGSARGFQRLIEGQLTVPVVAAVNGAAVAGGFELMMGCDVVVASSAAVFGLPEVKRGLFPAGGGTFLATRIPRAVASELLLTGDNIPAERAYELGLVNVVVPPDEVLTAALGYAERIAANGPLGLAAVKELIRLGVSDPARATERMAHWQQVVFSSADAQEGARAFIERRPPVWQGR
ncbi:MAG TPA: enoyl-CoA hydratase-related protein [Acidimicrobiales bacterium]|nr:enoyl-CoA hydratase-related protein [Acidimicrobiales bacterium]